MTADAVQGALFTHRNHYLFADYYLDRRSRERQEWREVDAGSAFAAVAAIWRKYKPQGDNEAQTEADWIRPVLEALGHRYNVQVGMQTPLGAKVPDYVFYPDEATRQAAKRGVLTEADFQGALAVGDAKAWERPLDRAAPKAVSTLHENPSLQIDTYIRHSGLAWGILTNGRLWRLYHKDTSKKLDVYYEVDLPALIEQGDAEAFKYFWLFFRREAFCVDLRGFRNLEGLAKPSQVAPAWLDLVLAESQAYEQGVSENLKAQVYDALRHLGQGFLDFPYNGLQPTAETLKQIHDNSLIVLYRLLFMLYAEARDLLPVRENRLYAEGYSLETLKSRIVRDLDDGIPAAASMSGLWQQLYEQWHVIDTGDAALGVPAYNGGLFRPDRHPFLERYRVGDLHLRQAIDLLARALDPVTGRREFVDYRDLEIRHLGSIYEGLLEYQLRCAAEPLVIVRQKGKERYEPAAGAVPDVPTGQVYLVTDKGERKATGSYYTPDYIVQYIVEQTVGPVLAERAAAFRKPDGKIADEAGLAQAILSINCLDPAMGSGHFLVAAAEYIARYVVGLGLAADETRQTFEVSENSKVSEPELAYWRRRVAQACIYGVDLNPLAVELAKLSLWLATVSKDKPLSFLDHHLGCGNSLIGARVADLPLGLAPAEQVAKERKAAYKAQDAARKKEEAARAAGQITMLDDSAFAGAMHTASGMMRLIEDLGSETLADVHRAEEVYRDSVRAVTERARLLGDVWTARHFGLALDDTIWGGLSRYLLHGGFEMPAYRPIIEHAQRIAGGQRFFHWELEFPEVFFDEHGRLVEEGGFDVVMGNPPYDVLSEKEREEDLSELISYISTSADLEPACGQKLDLFRLLAAKATSLVRIEEYVGLIVPMSLLADQQTANLRRHLLSNCPPVQIEAFPQKDDPHRRVFLEAKLPTCVVICRKQVTGTGAIKVTVHPGNKLNEVSGVFSCTVQDLAAIDPIDLPIPLLTSNLAVELLRKLAQYPRMGDRCQSYQGEINETTMSNILSVDPQDGPRVFRGGNIQRYEFIPEPKQGAARYLKLDAYHRTAGGERATHTQKDRIGYQRNAALDNWRRLIFAPLPNPSYCFDSISYLLAKDQLQACFLIAILNSRLLEWRFRLTSTNNHVSTAEIAALPIPDCRTAITSPAETRALLAAEAQGLAAAAVTTGDFTAILAFVVAQLAAQPERSDVVHDLLAGLAEQMIAMNKQKGDEMRGFLAWLEREAGAKIEDLTGRSQLRNYPGDYQKGETPLAFDDPLTSSGQSLLAILRKNSRKLAVDPSGRKFQESLKKEYEASLAVLLPLKARLAVTDRLIDQVVYRLYGLTEDEIAIVEDKGDQ
jgi:hypothetical protein